MQMLYVSQQGCYLSLRQEQVVVRQGEQVLQTVQLPLVEQILIFGQSQVTTQLVRACLGRDIPIVYLSRMGFCYGRLLPISRGYRQLVRYQQIVGFPSRLLTARAIVQAKLKNSRVLLLRQQRRRPTANLAPAIQTLEHLAQQAHRAEAIDQLMGLEGSGAASYYGAFADCLDPPEFVFTARSRRPPGNPVNAMLSFGYQVVWNHLLSLIELQGLDPYMACLHEGNHQHPALASDLVEEFRAPMVDSLVLYLVNRRIMKADGDFAFRDGGCFLNDAGRRKFLQAFVQRMEEPLTTAEGDRQPRWHLLANQVKAYKLFVYDPSCPYQPYQIR
jgi:CRISPR-associated protein Cas1